MKYIFYLLIIVAIVAIAFMALDYFGYYVEFKWAAIGLGGGLPIVHAIRTFRGKSLEKFENASRDFKKNFHTGLPDNPERNQAGIKKEIEELKKRIEKLEKIENHGIS